MVGGYQIIDLDQALENPNQDGQFTIVKGGIISTKKPIRFKSSKYPIPTDLVLASAEIDPTHETIYIFNYKGPWEDDTAADLKIECHILKDPGEAGLPDYPYYYGSVNIGLAE